MSPEARDAKPTELEGHGSTWEDVEYSRVEDPTEPNGRYVATWETKTPKGVVVKRHTLSAPVSAFYLLELCRETLTQGRAPDRLDLEEPV